MATKMKKLEKLPMSDTVSGLAAVCKLLNAEARKKNLRSQPYFLPRGFIAGMACREATIIFTMANGKGGFYHMETDFTCKELLIKHMPVLEEDLRPGFFRNIINFFSKK